MPDGKYGDFFEKYDPAPSRSYQTREPRQYTEYKRRKPSKKRYLKLAALLAPYVLGLIAIIVAVCLAVSFVVSLLKNDKEKEEGSYAALQLSSDTVSQEALPEHTLFAPVATESTVSIGGNIESEFGVLVDRSNSTVLAQKSADKKIYPASMTKIMVLLVAAELNVDLNDTFMMTSEIIDPLYREGSTMAGFMPNEMVRIEDLFYGSILESGGEATVALAIHIAGSEEAFVELMNKKAEILGLENTHFCNASGLHNDNHYTTCREMAIIMNAVLNNEFCRRVISTEYYNVPANDYHEELKFHSGMFEKMYGDEPEVATIKGGKTGYTVKSGNCLVSYALTDDGREIICVTASGGGKYVPIHDCIKLYKEYTH